MSAEVLREAARLMRERAEAAAGMSPSPWLVDAEIASLPCPYGVAFSTNYGPISVAESYSLAEVTHIASWHPTVALAVADLLEALAARADAICDATPTREFGESVARQNLTGYAIAIAIAHAYLGAASPPSDDAP